MLWLELSLHTVANHYDAVLCASLRRKLKRGPDVVRPATHAADWDFHASEELKAALEATLVLLGNRLPLMPDVSWRIIILEPYDSSAGHMCSTTPLSILHTGCPALHLLQMPTSHSCRF